jgi:prepilin-type processing-associated H-X9-DG protein
MNEYTGVDRLDPFGNLLETFRNADSLRNPSDTHTVFLISDRKDPNLSNDHTHSRNWHRGWNAVISDIQPDRHGLRKTAEHTSGSSNYLYADGHVGTIRASSLKRRVDNNENFARPPQ